MQIIRRGKPTKIPHKMCVDAIRFYGKYLLGPRLYDKITLDLQFRSLQRTPFSAYIECENDDIRPKNYIMVVHNGLSKKDTLLAIAHEMVHMKQYAKGEMRDLSRSLVVKYCGKYVDSSKIDYWEYPWEVEAHGREKGLYFKFLEQYDP